MSGVAGAPAAGGGRSGCSLDQRTQLRAGGGGVWVASAYPDVGEASITCCPVGLRDPDTLAALDEQAVAVQGVLNHERATRRAMVETRRYMVSNRSRYMWVLTFAEGLHGPEGRAECMRQVAEFATELRGLGGRFAYWYSPELHPGGHVNFFVSSRLRHEVIAGCGGTGTCG